MASARSLAADEVNVAGNEWISLCCRLALANGVEELPLAVLQLGEHRDSATLTAALLTALSSIGVAKSDLFDTKTIACAFDGAAVLLSGVVGKLRGLVPNDWPQPVSEHRHEVENVTIPSAAYQPQGSERPLGHLCALYCAGHRTQRVDHDTCTDDMGFLARMRSCLRNTVRFFRKSTKRWQGLCRIARQMGYSATHGSVGKSQLLRFPPIQKTRFVCWVARAARRWNRNLPVLVAFLKEMIGSSASRKSKDSARNLLKRVTDVSIVYGMRLNYWYGFFTINGFRLNHYQPFSWSSKKSLDRHSSSRKKS